MDDTYSPHTGEHIQTDTPADWMGRAGVAVPAYTPGAESAAWNGAAWEVVATQPTPEVFAPLTPWQVRQALQQAGKRQAVEDMVNAGSLALQDAWHYASEFKRDNELLVQMAATMGMPDSELDSLFRLGATL